MSDESYVERVEATDHNTGNTFYVEYENNTDREKISDIIGLLGPSVEGTAISFPNKNTYVFRKMSKEEFEITYRLQQMPKSLIKPDTGEKWTTESMQHTREFTNKKSKGPDVVSEFTVDKKGYEQIRENAIPQRGSAVKQPKEGPLFNVYNKERLMNQPDKLNIGLKGEKNIDAFNKHVVSVSKIDPDSFMNKYNILQWVRRHKIRAAAAAIGIAIDGGHLIISLIDDEGSFGKSTQIALGEIIGGTVGSNAAMVIGAKIGAALGSVVPGWGNIILGFIGGIVGSVVGAKLVKEARYLFCVEKAGEGSGVILDTDQYSSDANSSDKDMINAGGTDDQLVAEATGYGIHDIVSSPCETTKHQFWNHRSISSKYSS